MNPVLLRCRELLSKGGSIEDALTLLRTEGISKIESIRALTSLAGMSLPEAKRTVHFSKTWEDTREAGEHLHAVIEKALREEGGDDK